MSLKTMFITVHYLTQIRKAAGCATETIEAPTGCTLDGVLRQVADQRNATFRAMLLDDTGAVRRSLLLFVGDEHADLTRVLRDSDAVSILAPMAGG